MKTSHAEKTTAKKSAELNRGNLNYTIDSKKIERNGRQFGGENQFQKYLLDGVSRTFALTIAQLPDGLKGVVTNAYLLCRIIDTIEDEPTLSYYDKKIYCELFVHTVKKKTDPEKFAKSVYPKLSKHTSDREKELIGLTPGVIQITNSFHEAHRQALIECVEKMAKGMILFQEKRSVEGVEDLEEMEEYCYYVAGVVGEMLTKLFCLYSSEIALHEEKMLKLASSFGKGLQMTNILKDLWKDYDHSVCWLPRSVFEKNGFDLKDLKNRKPTKEMQNSIIHLIGVAHKHLENAVQYSLMIPKKETGIRKFCLWAIGMAVLTLRKIYKNLDYVDSDQVKIRRSSVKATILTTNLFIENNFMLKTLFDLTRSGIPYHKGEPYHLDDK